MLYNSMAINRTLGFTSSAKADLRRAPCAARKPSLWLQGLVSPYLIA